MANEKIHLRQGDTDLIAYGGGHGSSRATYMGGTAMWRASDEIIEKGTALAADMLEASEADIRFEDGALRGLGHRPRRRPARGGGARRARKASRSTPITSGSASTSPSPTARMSSRSRSIPRPAG